MLNLAICLCRQIEWLFKLCPSASVLLVVYRFPVRLFANFKLVWTFWSIEDKSIFGMYTSCVRHFQTPNISFAKSNTSRRANSINMLTNTLNKRNKVNNNRVMILGLIVNLFPYVRKLSNVQNPEKIHCSQKRVFSDDCLELFLAETVC